MEKKAVSAQKRYYLLRLTAIVGGVTLPALVSLNISGESVSAYLCWLTFCISLLVAISVAVEGFFNYGERWRHYRRTVEDLKREGWQFFQLSGPYGVVRIMQKRILFLPVGWKIFFSRKLKCMLLR